MWMLCTFLFDVFCLKVVGLEPSSDIVAGSGKPLSITADALD